MSHTYSNNIFHIIFSTKGRIGLISSDFKNDLYKYISGIAKNQDAQILKINGIDNHVHILVKIKPSISVSDFVCKLKSNSSKWISENIDLILFRFHRDSNFITSMSGFNPTINWRFKNRLTLWMQLGISYGFQWQGGFSSFSVSESQVAGISE